MADVDEQAGEEFASGGESSESTHGEQTTQAGSGGEKDFWDNPAELSKAYRELKSVTDKLSEQVNSHGGIDSLVEDRQLLEQILADQRVQKAIETPESTETVEPDFVPENEEQEKALKFLDKYMEGKLQKRDEALLEKILPSVVQLKSSETQRTVAGNLTVLEKYCQEEGLPPWKELESEMTDIHEGLVKKGVVPQGAGVHGGVEYLKMLYLGALTGKPERVLKVAKDIISKETEKAKSMATSKTTTSPSAEGAAQAKSVADAFKFAKQKHGLA